MQSALSSLANTELVAVLFLLTHDAFHSVWEQVCCHPTFVYLVALAIYAQTALLSNEVSFLFPVICVPVVGKGVHGGAFAARSQFFPMRYMGEQTILFFFLLFHKALSTLE